jgi:hypothetical protein
LVDQGKDVESGESGGVDQGLTFIFGEKHGYGKSAVDNPASVLLLGDEPGLCKDHGDELMNGVHGLGVVLDGQKRVFDGVIVLIQDHWVEDFVGIVHIRFNPLSGRLCVLATQ